MTPVAPAFVCVLGMHRSGTSCLAGTLQQAGLYGGRVHEWNPFNRKGNRENQEIVDLNDTVLAHSGAAWDRPPVRLRWSVAHAAERDRLVAELVAAAAGAPAVGFKDPRTLLTLELWRAAAVAWSWVGTFRHPLAVARSLRARDPRVEQAAALELWRAYNARLLALHDETPFPLLCFDDEPALYARKLAQVAAVLWPGAAAAAGDFFDPALRRQQVAGEEAELAPALGEIHRELRARAA